MLNFEGRSLLPQPHVIGSRFLEGTSSNRVTISSACRKSVIVDRRGESHVAWLLVRGVETDEMQATDVRLNRIGSVD